MKWLGLLIMISSPVLAVTPEQIQACAPDASRLCSSEFQSGAAAIKACMIKNKSKLSDECRKAFPK